MLDVPHRLIAQFVHIHAWQVFELLVGLVQAIVFGGLTLVFATIAVTPHEAETA